MNFLAHLYLAEPTPASRVGNLLPDFARGRALAGPERPRRGRPVPDRAEPEDLAVADAGAGDVDDRDVVHAGVRKRPFDHDLDRE